MLVWSRPPFYHICIVFFCVFVFVFESTVELEGVGHGAIPAGRAGRDTPVMEYPSTTG